MSDGPKLEWFGGNQDAMNVYHMFVDLLHVWDDLVDKDKDVSESELNNTFLIALVYLPANPFYRSIQDQILPMWLTVVSSYEAANRFEREKDPHGVEIAHTLRYSAGNIIAYVIHVCVGAEKAREFIPEMWKSVVHERFEPYREEHLNDHPKQA
jgi:hypothetical protein